MPDNFYPAWSLRADAEEAGHLERICLDANSRYAAVPAPVGTPAWWAAVDTKLIPTVVRVGEIVQGIGRPGDGDALVVLREADGTETDYEARFSREPWRLVGSEARVTVALHPAKPGRGEVTCVRPLLDVPILFELGLRRRRGGRRGNGRGG